MLAILRLLGTLIVSQFKSRRRLEWICPFGIPTLMADLVRRRVAVIATPAGNYAAQVAKAATTDIPIVFGVLQPSRSATAEDKFLRFFALPAPLRPMRIVVRAGAILMLTSRSTSCWLKRTRTFSRRSIRQCRSRVRGPQHCARPPRARRRRPPDPHPRPGRGGRIAPRRSCRARRRVL